MRKLAIFVEGHTELILLEKMLPEFFGHGNVKMVIERQHGGNTRILRAYGEESTALYQVQLTNCESDGKVKPFLLERRERLENEGYEVLIGLQDVYPHFTFAELEKVKAGLQKGIPADSPFVKLCLAVMEVEAWFLGESTHFERVHPALTADHIRKETGFDPTSAIAEETIHHPTKLLKKIYKLVGLEYDKHEGEVHRTVSAMDPDNFLVEVRGKSKSLDHFLNQLEEFMRGAGVQAEVVAA